MPFKVGNAFTVIILLFFALGLGIIALELANPPRLQERDSARPVQAGPGAATVVKSFALPPLQRYEGIVERPLFLASRRPPEIPPAAPQKPADEGGELRLLGVVLTPGRLVALLQVDGSGKTVHLKVGEKANGWQLESVSAKAVLLRRGEAVRNLPLVRSDKPSAPSVKMRKTEKNQSAQGAAPAAPTKTAAQ